MTSDTFHSLIHVLRPSYKLLSCKGLAGRILDFFHSEIEESVKENLKGREEILMIDEWSNIHNEPTTAS